MEGNQIETITKYATSKHNFDEVFRKKKEIDLTKSDIMKMFDLPERKQGK